MTIPRVEFDSTIDEGVDAQLRLAKSMKAYGRQRLRSQLGVALAAGLALAASSLSGADELSVPFVAVTVGVAAVAGMLCWYLYGWFHDWYIRSNTRRYVREQYGDGTVHCVYEVRDEGLWAKARDTEILFAWARLKRIVDGDDVEVWFDPGLAVIRARAFPTADIRRQFVEAVGQHAV